MTRPPSQPASPVKSISAHVSLKKKNVKKKKRKPKTKEKKRKEKRGETDTVKKKLTSPPRLTPHAATGSRRIRHTQTGNGHTNAATVATPTRDPS